MQTCSKVLYLLASEICLVLLFLSLGVNIEFLDFCQKIILTVRSSKNQLCLNSLHTFLINFPVFKRPLCFGLGLGKKVTQCAENNTRPTAQKLLSWANLNCCKQRHKLKNIQPFGYTSNSSNSSSGYFHFNYEKLSELVLWSCQILWPRKWCQKIF